MSRRFPTALAGLAMAFALLLPTALPAQSGEELYREVIQRIGVYDDPELAQYIGGLVAEIVAVSEDADEQFTFTLLDAPDVNAFATRGNYVYVNRGLLHYVQNEAQLVSVLAHEVAHVTEGHVVEMQAQSGGAKILAMIAAMLSGSPEVYDAGMAYANSLIKGHGRKNELEADETGARYMAKLGYDPGEIIEMLSTMKDMEALMKKRAAEQGATRRTYHGIFSTHPRNDMRLRSAVSRAARIDTSGTRDNGEERYRRMTEGLVWGENFKEKEPPATRWTDMNLRVRFDFPEGWTQQNADPSYLARGQAEDGAATLTLTREGRTLQTPEEYIYNHLDVSRLRDGKEISPARLKGYTGVVPGDGSAPDKRLAVVYYKLNAFIFEGEVDAGESFENFDEQFLEAIDTFRPVSRREIVGQKPKTIHYVRATGATTFAALGEALNLSDSEVDDLRLINGYYPAGEPKEGDWIKIFRQAEDEEGE